MVRRHAGEKQPVRPEREVEVAGSLEGRSILAADDHEVNRRILTLLLEPHGCRLTLVENGAEAVEAAASASAPFSTSVRRQP